MLAASLPVLHWSASVPKNDAEVTFFLLCSLIAALRWRAGSDFKWTQAGVLFLACALATKDPAIFGAIPLGIVFLFAAWRQPGRLRAFASLALTFAIFALIWNVRRYLLTGNPIFPLAPGQSTVAGWPPDPSLGGTILRILRLPWDLHVHGHDFSDTVLIAPLGIAFVVLWPVWLLTRKRLRSPERLSLGFAITALLVWGWLSPVARYAVAPLAVFALLTGIRLARLWRVSPAITRASLAAASLWVLIPAICACMIIEINLPQLRYVAGVLGRDQYLSQADVDYPALAWLRDHTAPAERILGLENCSDVYAPPFPRYQSYCAFRPWTAAEVEGQLRGASFDWLLAPAGYEQAGLAAVAATERSAAEVFRDRSFVIYRLQ
jgi:4-amino-4-deoxy-L-arabinose transferase-like glycosyltransferase